MLEKPLEEDEFFIEPEEVYAGKILQSIVMSLPRLAQSFRNFYASGYRWLLPISVEREGAGAGLRRRARQAGAAGTA